MNNMDLAICKLYFADKDVVKRRMVLKNCTWQELYGLLSVLFVYRDADLTIQADISYGLYIIFEPYCEDDGKCFLSNSMFQSELLKSCLAWHTLQVKDRAEVEEHYARGVHNLLDRGVSYSLVNYPLSFNVYVRLCYMTLGQIGDKQTRKATLETFLAHDDFEI